MNGSILYITSRFPKVTETFVINEWLVLRSRFDMYLAALRRTRETLVQAESASVLPDVWFVRVATLASFGDHARWLARRPRAYLTTLGILICDGAARPRGLLKSIAAFGKAVPIATRARKAGVTHVHAHFANHPATAAWVVHRLTGLPFTFTAHANDLFLRPAVLERKLGAAAFVVAVSEYNAEIMRRSVPDSTVHVVHCGVDNRRFVLRTGAGIRSRVLCVASLESKKGHRFLFEAASILVRQGYPLRIIMVGEGPERAALEQCARNLGIAHRVEFLGVRDAAEVAAELQRADVFVLPSVPDATGRMEGIPVALMEAMASGVPVITTRLSGIPELVDGAGVLVEPMDARALSLAIARVIDDDGLALALVDVARARVLEDFDLVTQATRLADLFDGARVR